VVLVGHGGIPTDCPRDLVIKLKRLESERKHTGQSASSDEMEIDRTIRHWPRTATTDPYQAGLQALASSLRRQLGETLFGVAYNEYCDPTLEDAVAELVRQGATEITVITTMFTPGGSHSEIEIPQTIDRLRQVYQGVTLHYAWPFDLDLVASMLAAQIRSSV
jgi:sirohydrochlorin cobaltochelatase